MAESQNIEYKESWGGGTNTKYVRPPKKGEIELK